MKCSIDTTFSRYNKMSFSAKTFYNRTVVIDSNKFINSHILDDVNVNFLFNTTMYVTYRHL